MAGKAYTMREMRSIVDYLKEHKAYGELKGRKMWMEFANSNNTIRSWQSLKETFLKRILPDIHNPYYKLTMDELRSFQQGFDVAAKEKHNRLQFKTPDNELNGIKKSSKKNKPASRQSSVEKLKINTESPATNIDEEMEKVTGEDANAAKISRSRSSTETVVLEYVKAEDIQRALETPPTIIDTQTISTKDKLAFEHSAPLTPIVQSVLNDFETDSEESDKERRLQIVEDIPKSNGTEPEIRAEDYLEVNTIEETPPENGVLNNEVDSTVPTRNSNTNKNDSNSEKKNIPVVNLIEDSPENSVAAIENMNSKQDTQSISKMTEQDTQIPNAQISPKNSIANTKSVHEDITVIEASAKTFEKVSDTPKNKSNTTISTQNTADTLLPNNQEALGSKNGTQNTTADELIVKTNQRNVNKFEKISSSREDKETKKQNTSPDTLLPNNQEDLDVSIKEMQNAKPDKTIKTSNRRKERSTSRDDKETKKQKTSDDKSIETNKSKESTAVLEITEASQSILKSKCLNTNEEVIEINTDSPTTEKTENQVEICKPTLDNHDDVTTNKKDLDLVPDTALDQESQKEEKNPCLLSVSLFEEQFKNTTYSDNDSDQTNKQKTKLDRPQTSEMEQLPEKTKENKKTELVHRKTAAISVENNIKVDENVISSESESEPRAQGMVKNKMKPTVNLQREKAMANVFGFSHGTAPTNRKRRYSHRRRSHHYRRRQSINLDSNSSEWTSESDSESYVSPPRGRKYRQTRKFLKPKSSRILQDPEEGMLYVIFGKNIYPVVRDGKHIKKFLTYKPDSDSDEDNVFWKQKYSQEKKKLEEIRKLLKETQRNNEAQLLQESRQAQSPKSEKLPPRNSQNVNSNDHGAAEKENKVENKDEKMVIKIAGKNGLEYSLEGGWEQISNAMPQVVKMMQNETADQPKPVNGTNQSNTRVEVSSGNSTPVLTDKEAVEKINKLETEIFNEIKTLEEIEKDTEVKQTDSDSINVTKRKRGRKPRKETLSPTPQTIPVKKPRATKTSSSDSKTENKRTTRAKLNLDDKKENEAKQGENEGTSAMVPPTEQVTSNAKSPSKQKLDNTVKSRSASRVSRRGEVSEDNAGNRPSLRTIRTPVKYDTDASVNGDKSRAAKNKVTADLFNDENVRYMFPPTETNTKATENINRSLLGTNIPSQEILVNSVNITQEYLDSDQSCMNICLPKRKRRISYTVRNRHKERRISRKPYRSLLIDSLSCDSSNSKYFVPVRTSQSSINSEIYKSDSYRFLLPKDKPTYKNLERIDENRPAFDKIEYNKRNFESISKNSNKSTDNSGLILEIGNSSVISPPISPELSVVKRLSISREMIKDANHPTINESQLNEHSRPADYSEYMISNIDVSVPLMNQKCDLRETADEATKNKSILESMQIKDCTVNLTLSDSIDRRLKELLLETNKKPKSTNINNSTPVPMEVNEEQTTVKKPRSRKQKENVAMDVDATEATVKKAKAKKRSSTPRKKKATVKPTPPDNPIIEEHTESCLRRSCPPVITLAPVNDNANNSSDVVINPPKTKTKKKNSSKRNTQTPKDKTSKRTRGQSSVNASVESSHIDSGINESGTMSLLKDCSVDLIHNHSETCLLATECIDNESVEYINNSLVSMISLSTSSTSRQSENSDFFKDFKSDVMLSEDTSNNAIDTKCKLSSPETVYHSPVASINSLITEDLSNSPREPSKWYLLDEDVTNFEPASASFGSNLHQIFPITCAVPNLSTISEKSRDC